MIFCQIISIQCTGIIIDCSGLCIARNSFSDKRCGHWISYFYSLYKPIGKVHIFAFDVVWIFVSLWVFFLGIRGLKSLYLIWAECSRQLFWSMFVRYLSFLLWCCTLTKFYLLYLNNDIATLFKTRLFKNIDC